MDERIQSFVLTEIQFGSNVAELYGKLIEFLDMEKCTELKLLNEYFNIQMKNGLENSKCYNDIIDVYYKQKFYFDLLENAILCLPYIKRELEQSNLNKEEQQCIDALLKDVMENLNSYGIYFKYLLKDIELNEYETIKMTAIFDCFQGKQKEIETKLEMGNTLIEIITREEKYITKLNTLLNTVDDHSDNPEEIVGVMAKIYAGEQQFINDLKKCDWDCDTNYFVECCRRHMLLFHLYAEEQRLKRAQVINILPEPFKEILRERNVDLYMCIKHLMSFSLFFDKLEKNVPEPYMKLELQELKKEIINITKEADDLFAIYNILRCNIPLEGIGQFIARGMVTFVRKHDHELYLFEDALIITEKQNKKTEKQFKHVQESTGSIPVVYYKSHIMRNYLLIVEMNNDRFEIKKNLCHDVDEYSFRIEESVFKDQFLEYMHRTINK